MCEVGSDIICPSNLRLQIGTDGISSLSFVPDESKILLVSATSNGRIRIFDCSNTTPKTLYRKRWHTNIRCLLVNPFAANMCITASKQCCIKAHDLETMQRTLYCKKMDDSSPYSALIAVSDHRWITGDDCGFVKLWDDRLPSCHCFTIKPITDDSSEVNNDLVAINDFAVGSDPQGTLLAAVDSGVLASYNMRRRRCEMLSEPLGYSARSVVTIKDGKKVLLGTDEGVVHTYNWGEFGSVCDRFPVRTSRTRVDQLSNAKSFGDAGLPAIENIVKFTEDIVVIATDDGAISPMRILPNRMLNCLGWHSSEEFEGGDCMTLALSPNGRMIASGVPLAPNIKFWPTNHLEEEALAEVEILSLPKKQRLSKDLTSTRSAKSKSTSRGMDRTRSDFMSGIFAPLEEDSDSSDSGDN